MPIRQLSQSLINKIAAGEVIERPASVVKELMENAVDAGASRIDVALRQGGLEMIRVVDNGGGIPPEELPLAVASHATSKLVEADDLFHITTLGFRGEALASIGEISRLLLRSRTADRENGAELEVVGGQCGAAAPCGGPPGTLIEVSNLFFNTPVRRKFLRTTQTEFGHASEVFTRIALATPGVHFTLRHNDRLVFELPAASSALERIATFFGRELAGQLIWVESGDDDVRLSGYVAHPGQSRSHNRMQYVFLNRRYIRDRALQHALSEAYRGLLMVGRYPIAFLDLAMPPEMVDVNVHPTKLEVRFQESGRVYSQLLATLRSRFLSTDLTTIVGPTRPVGGDHATPPESDASPHDTARAAELRQQLVDWAKGQLAAERPVAPTTGPAAAAALTASDVSAEGAAFGSAEEDAELRLCLLPPSVVSPAATGSASTGNPPAAADSIPEGPNWDATAHAAADAANPVVGRFDAPAALPPAPLGRPRATALQVHNRYLVTESEAGVTIIDQHALHERILFEQLRRRIEAGPIETQQLLVPEPVDLRTVEAAAAMEHRELLGQLGLKLEAFGGDTILIVGFPSLLANLNPGEVLRGLIEKLLSGAKLPDRRDLLDELLHTIACKAAIKAGDRLSPDEIDELLEKRHLVDDAHHCPHGRPTELIFTREDLDRRFRRI